MGGPSPTVSHHMTDKENRSTFIGGLTQRPDGDKTIMSLVLWPSSEKRWPCDLMTSLPWTKRGFGLKTEAQTWSWVRALPDRRALYCVAARELERPSLWGNVRSRQNRWEPGQRRMGPEHTAWSSLGSHPLSLSHIPFLPSESLSLAHAQGERNQAPPLDRRSTKELVGI